MKLQMIVLCITYCFLHVVVVLPLPTKDLINKEHNVTAAAVLSNNTDRDNDSSASNATDLLTSSTTQKLKNLQLPTTLKPQHGAILIEDTHSSSQEPLTPAAQNFFSTFFQPHHMPPLGHSRPFYQTTEEPFIAKFLTQPHPKQFLHRPRQQSYTQFDPTLMGSGDFGILRGGTFYSNEEFSYQQEDDTDTEYYYSEASNTHGGPVTEGFIHKYTYPEEQFAQFRDFADLNAPADAAFSQYVVVYAAKNSTDTSKRKLPNNIFDQLQQIDEEKAKEEEQKRKKNAKGLSPTKLKLIKTKIIKKRLDKKSAKPFDDDPLLALS